MVYVWALGGLLLTIGAWVLDLLLTRHRIYRLYPFESFAVAIAGVVCALHGFEGLAGAISVLAILCAAIFIGWTLHLSTFKAGEVAIAVGEELPDIRMQDSSGEVVPLSRHFGEAATVIIAYRGKWDPTCVAELTGWKQEATGLMARGVRIIGISSDPPDDLKSLAGRLGEAITLLGDHERQGMLALGLLHRGGMPVTGKDIFIPATLVINGQGRVLWSQRVTNTRVRPRCQEVLEGAGLTV